MGSSLPAARDSRQCHVWVGQTGLLGRILDSGRRAISGAWVLCMSPVVPSPHPSTRQAERGCPTCAVAPAKAEGQVRGSLVQGPDALLIPWEGEPPMNRSAEHRRGARRSARPSTPMRSSRAQGAMKARGVISMNPALRSRARPQPVEWSPPFGQERETNRPVGPAAPMPTTKSGH